MRLVCDEGVAVVGATHDPAHPAVAHHVVALQDRRRSPAECPERLGRIWLARPRS